MINIQSRIAELASNTCHAEMHMMDPHLDSNKARMLTCLRRTQVSRRYHDDHLNRPFEGQRYDGVAYHKSCNGKPFLQYQQKYKSSKLATTIAAIRTCSFGIVTNSSMAFIGVNASATTIANTA